MARVIFKKGQPIQSLSGTIGRYTYRTINGKTFVHATKERVLAVDASRKEKALFKRESMIDQCTEILQNEMKNVQEAIRMRNKIRSRLRSLYEKYHKEIKGTTKLQTRIMSEYRWKWDTRPGFVLRTATGRSIGQSPSPLKGGEGNGKGISRS